MPPSKKKRGKAAGHQPANVQLIKAADEGDTAAVARLLAAGADPNALASGRDPSGKAFQTTALIEAAGEGRPETVRLLLDAGADPSLANGEGFAPLMGAALRGQLEVLRLLLARGAAADAAHPHNGWTAFHHACFESQVECAEALARAGCDVGIKAKYGGKTGIELADGEGHGEVAARLRAVAGEQLRAAGPSPAPMPAAVSADEGVVDQLAQAAAEGDGAAVARLLAVGGDPNALLPLRNVSGGVAQTTALGAAVEYDRLEAARLLLDAGADPSLVGGDGSTPLMFAAATGHLQMLRLLLARGAPVDTVRPAGGSTAFHHACYNNQAECAEALARAGCDVGLKATDGRPGRELAERQGHAAVVARLRAVVGEQLRAAQAAGPSPAPAAVAVAADEGAVDLLAQAAWEGEGVAVARLLAAGGDPNALVPWRDASGEALHTTALHVAAACGKLDAARLLLDAGADPSRGDGNGDTSHGWYCH
jgi:ankyrin repeat protein